MANSNRGTRRSTSATTAASPCWRRRSQGSRPLGSTATNVCVTKRWSSSKARSAAFWPAASPSKVKTTLPAHLVVVHEQAAQDLDVLGAERGAAGGDRGRDAGEVAGHDVGVALDDDGLLVLGDVATGQVDAVEHLALLVDRRLGGVEVLRAVVVVEQLAGAEADDLAAEVADRPHQPAAEAVVDAAVALADEPAGEQLRVGEALLAQVVGQRVPALGREADAEVGGRIGVEAARR